MKTFGGPGSLLDLGCALVLRVAKRRRSTCGTSSSEKAIAMTMEQVVTQLQQKLSNLRAQVGEESGLADAVRATNNLATAQVRKDTPSLTEVKGLGRPKEFTGREEDF